MELAWHLSLSLLRFPKSLTKSVKLVKVLKGPRCEQSQPGFAALSCGEQDLFPWFSLALVVKGLSSGGEGAEPGRAALALGSF